MLLKILIPELKNSLYRYIKELNHLLTRGSKTSVLGLDDGLGMTGI